jgi:hypothetical protein
MFDHYAGAALSFDALALERCFLAADILADDFASPRSEYAMLGLATEDDPFHVIATPLLRGQRVTVSTVEQSGHDVLRMRREIESLSARMGRRLVPITFVHRHPGPCTASVVDREFLTGVFIDQVSTAISWTEAVPIGPGHPRCGCAGMVQLWRDAAFTGGVIRNLHQEYAVCFSLIVNGERDYEIYAARVDTCPMCGRRQVREIPAQLESAGRVILSTSQRDALRRRLALEIAEKVVFDPTPAPALAETL